MRKLLIILQILVLASCTQVQEKVIDWQLDEFVKVDSLNPVLLPDTTTLFMDPIRNENVRWEGKDVFNPSTVVRNDTLFMLYRAEDFVGKYNGTSRIGIAYSLDGLNFTRYDQPVFYPDNDEAKIYEWEGGVEDPRIVEDDNGQYIMTYTAYDGDKARLLIASSNDLINWTKYGSVFTNNEYINTWTKSGSIVSTIERGKMVATKINGKYWMYFGDTNIFLATSDDLITWEPILDSEDNWLAVLKVREGMFDSDLVEPGPPAIITSQGILLIYNGKNKAESGDLVLPTGTYAAGQALYSIKDPVKLVERSDKYFFHPTKNYEITGQVNNVCFVEGLSLYKGNWYLYYGTADSKIAVAVRKKDFKL